MQTRCRIKKFTCLFVFFVLLLSAINSQEENNSSGAFAVNAYFSNYFPVSAWSDYVILSLGGGGGVEYALPLELGAADLGVQLKSEYAFVVPRDAQVNAFSDITVMPGVFVNLPFAFENIEMSFHPELAYGVDFHIIKTGGKQNVYIDQLVYVALPVRFALPALDMFELELAPAYTFLFEKQGTFVQTGYRAGIVWRF